MVRPYKVCTSDYVSWASDGGQLVCGRLSNDGMEWQMSDKSEMSGLELQSTPDFKPLNLGSMVLLFLADYHKKLPSSPSDILIGDCREMRLVHGVSGRKSVTTLTSKISKNEVHRFEYYLRKNKEERDIFIISASSPQPQSSKKR